MAMQVEERLLEVEGLGQFWADVVVPGNMLLSVAVGFVQRALRAKGRNDVRSQPGVWKVQ